MVTTNETIATKMKGDTLSDIPTLNSANCTQWLVAEIHQLRQQNATLTAQLLKLPTTDITPDEMAQAIIAGCPEWRAVTTALVFHAIKPLASVILQEENHDTD